MSLMLSNLLHLHIQQDGDSDKIEKMDLIFYVTG